MTTQATSPSSDNDSNSRKRVCKACDRCRLKKSKCDGSSPCSRCRTDNAICVFGERKKSHDKVYPKGYVEMLEQQQQQLVNGLQELYDIVISNRGWKGSLLKDSSNGRPLTHDILERLGALKLESSVEVERFEEDLDALRQKIALDEAGSPRNCSADSDFQSQTAFPECSSPKYISSDLFPVFTSFPPTPPIHHPTEQASLTFVSSPNRINLATSVDPSTLQSPRQSWAPPQPITYDESLDFLRFEMPSELAGLHSIQEPAGHCLPLSPWIDEYLDPFEVNAGMT